MIRKRCASLLPAVFCLAGMAFGQNSLVDFSGNGSLAFTDDGGKTNAVELYGAAPKFLPREDKQGIYLTPGMTLNIPVEKFNPRQGTISFWFRPDWSPGDATMHPILLIKAPPAFTLNFTKGWYTARDTCYIFVDLAEGGTSFGSYNIFAGRTWRHYALRWDSGQSQMQVVVDGEARGDSGLQRTGGLKTDKVGPLKATVTLSGAACGAYADVKIFDHCLSVPEIMRVAGLRQAARHLQEQRPPLGGEKVVKPHTAGGTYVDPLTGLTVSRYGGDGDEDAHAGMAYDPERMEILPETPHT
ncbi:MAG: hypothetical protein PHR35_06775, partial [Kiritimatiellae bacterium]|nr:hypothetical protein [Kiritimatiellia bacterium]